MIEFDVWLVEIYLGIFGIWFECDFNVIYLEFNCDICNMYEGGEFYWDMMVCVCLWIDEIVCFVVVVFGLMVVVVYGGLISVIF